MYRYARINIDNVVTSISELHSIIEAPNLIQIDEQQAVDLGYIYSGGVFVAPQITQPAPDKRITPNAFQKRFTDAEAVNIDLASIGATVQAATLRRHVKLSETASFIDLDDPLSVGGVNAMAAAGLISAQRAIEILTNPIQDSERP